MPFFRKPDSEALWKEEFSIHAADEHYVSRRQFTKFLTLASLGMFVGNLWILARSYFTRSTVFPRSTVAGIAEIPVGGVKLFAYPTPADRCILVRIAENEYNAFSQKCTHLSCAVYYEKETNRLACPCHNGYFSATDGSVLQGPPPRRLPRILLERQDHEFVAIGVKVG
jgi:nitrite reductase/ring-hydroxylating ferredoxin subunit